MAQLLYRFVSNPPRFCICFQHLTYRFQFPNFRFTENHLNYGRNLGEMDTAVQKRGYRDLVCGVECNSFRTSSLRCFIGQTQAREFSHIRWFEIEVS